MRSIALRGVLPQVFRAGATEEAIRRSEIWLRPEVTFTRPGAYVVEAGSGAGKSSLCSYIYGARRDYDGTILFDGTDIRTFTRSRWCELRQRSLAYLPQEMRLFPELTAMENIQIKNRLTDCRTEAEIMLLLERLEVEGKAGQRAGLLSVGQQQRVAIVRALCQPFDFLLVDEPVSHLDARNNAAVASLIVEEAAAREAAVIVTSVGNMLQLTDYKMLRL